MSVSICIAHENKEVLDTNYFIDLVTKKWSATRIHFINDRNSHYILQFETPDEFWILGDFSGTGVWYYHGRSSKSDAEFALWYRSIVPAESGVC